MTYPTIADELRAVRTLIASPTHWTQHNYAVDANGGAVHPQDEWARRWCLSGACRKVGAPRAHGAIMRAIGRPMAEWNDSHAHADVIALLDRLIVQADDPW